MNSPSRIRRSRMSFEMNRALQWKLIAGFLLVFVAGGITGAFVGGSYARHHFFELHHPERIGGRMKERLRVELNLTPEQLTKISPIIDKTTAQMRDIRRDTGTGDIITFTIIRPKSRRPHLNCPLGPAKVTGQKRRPFSKRIRSRSTSAPRV